MSLGIFNHENSSCTSIVPGAILIKVMCGLFVRYQHYICHYFNNCWQIFLIKMRDKNENISESPITVKSRRLLNGIHFYVFSNPFSNTVKRRLEFLFMRSFLLKTFPIHLSLAYTIFARVQILLFLVKRWLLYS